MKTETETKPQENYDHGGNMAGDTSYYGVLPSIAGVLFGLALIAFMFALADGFA